MREQIDPDRPKDPTGKENDSPFVVSVLNRQRTICIDVKSIQSRIKICLHALHFHEAEVCVVLVSDRTIQKLNRRYLGREGPTDVIAFSMREGLGADMNPHMLGDVVISLETADTQARYLGISLDEELDVLLVHGLLHLLGYEHTGPRREASRMWRKQRSMVKKMRRALNNRGE